jgi:hypothetical protein
MVERICFNMVEFCCLTRANVVLFYFELIITDANTSLKLLTSALIHPKYYSTIRFPSFADRLAASSISITTIL